jgi:SAM-dependent methyltransferase
MVGPEASGFDVCDVLTPYARPGDHAAMTDLVRRYSTNRSDVREVALEGVDLSRVRSVLDLGCGYGFMTEVLARRCPEGVVVTGVDALPANGPPFLEALARARRSGCFRALRLGRSLPWPDRSFDVVVASYSLYYFVEAIPEISRILDPKGVFLALTHCRNTLARVVAIGGLPTTGTLLARLMRCFCNECALERLQPWFEDVHRTDFPNRLVFSIEDRSDLLRFVTFKLPQLLPPGSSLAEFRRRLCRDVSDALTRSGRMVIEKDDAILHCRRPRCP